MKLPAEMMKDYYERAWWIINQNPETDEEVKELELISRRKFAEECFGCYYED
mgnify:FL=1